MKIIIKFNLSSIRGFLTFLACLFSTPVLLVSILIEEIIVYYRLISKGHNLKEASKVYDRLVTIRAISAVRDYYGDKNLLMEDVPERVRQSQVAA